MRRAGFSSALSLTLVLAAGSFAAMLPVASALIDPTPLPATLGSEQNQDTETLLYAFAFAVLLPLSVWLAPRLADRIAAGPNAEGLGLLTALLTGSLAGALIVARVADRISSVQSEWLAAVAAGAWWLLAAGLLYRTLRPRPWQALLRLAGRTDAAWTAAALVLLGAVASLTALRALSVPALIVAAALAAALGYATLRNSLPRPAAKLRRALDLAAVVLVLLAVPDLVVFRPEEAAGNLGVAFETGIIQFHQNFLLGPANQVLAGNAVLVDTSSQYGVGPIYLLSAWFQIAPIGYGTFALLDGILTGLYFATGYGILRLARVGQAMSVATMAVAVLALAYNHRYPVGGIPQQGPIRFGLPILVVLLAVLGARFPARRQLARGACLVVVGASSVWAIEAFAYTAATFAGIALLEAAAASGGRLRRLVRDALAALAACLGAHLIFAGATLLFAGQLPDWGQYFAYLDRFLGTLGDLTYDVTPWSPAFAVGGVNFASAVALALLARRRREELAREWVPAVALAGTTAYGIALFSYYIDRSGDHILPYVSLPPLLVASIWLSLLIRRADSVPQGVRAGALAFGLSVAALMCAAAWPSADARMPQSALAHALPRGNSFRDAVSRLWNPPPLDARSPAAETALDRYLPNDKETLILVPPDLGLEVLFRTGRSSALPFGDPWEDGFVAEEHYGPLADAIAAIEPGSRMLLARRGLKALNLPQATGSEDPVAGFRVVGGLSPLQQWALRKIANRFRLAPVASVSNGLIVVELRDRKPLPPARKRRALLYILPPGGFAFPATLDLMEEARRAARAHGFQPREIDYPLGNPTRAWEFVRDDARRAVRAGREVYAYGESAGGVLSSLLAERGIAEAAVSNGAPNNLTNFYTDDVWSDPLPYGFGLPLSDRRRLSPVFRPTRHPILVQQSRNGDPFYEMNRRWAARDPRVRLAIYPGGHVRGTGPAGYARILEQALAYLRAARDR
ncbi:MAG TPA: hypothetical protein VKA89_04290 [Solirubrobacterales bacterium]|nr:hypothetical protein [Solirubrobacterales bacterium]